MKGKKTGGRKKGTPNKTTASIREALKTFIDDKRPDFEKAFTKLSPKEKVLAFTRLLPFVTPQYSAISFDLNNMTEDDLEIIENHLREKYKSNDTQQ